MMTPRMLALADRINEGTAKLVREICETGDAQVEWTHDHENRPLRAWMRELCEADGRSGKAAPEAPTEDDEWVERP